MRCWLAALALLVGCSRSVPATRYYQLVAPTPVAAGDNDANAILVVEPFAADAAYDDVRIVYRESQYRLDYYYYHRWAASPGALVSDFLRDAYRRTGRFRRVTGALDEQGTVVLTGRVVALEEVDRSSGRWAGRVVVELALHEGDSGALVWSKRVEESEPVELRTPEGVARAVSIAMLRIVERTAPEIARRAGIVAARQSP